MHIEIWSDFACPFCYIGKKRFEEALQDFSHPEDVTSEFKSYQLEPGAPKYNGQDFYESMAKKFGSVEQAKNITQNVIDQAKTVDLDFNFDHAKPTNTFNAHRLNKYAYDKGNTNLQEKLFAAYFIDGLDIGNDQTLASLAEASGLDAEEVETVLNDETLFERNVKTDIEEASKFGVTGVPFFIINRKYAISGAQPKEAFTQALEQVWNEENQVQTITNLNKDHSGVCTDDHCDIPTEETN